MTVPRYRGQMEEIVLTEKRDWHQLTEVKHSGAV